MESESLDVRELNAISGSRLTLVVTESEESRSEVEIDFDCNCAVAGLFKMSSYA